METDQTVDPAAQAGGRPGQVNMSEVVNGILYVVRTGCSWRQPPQALDRGAHLRVVRQVAPTVQGLRDTDRVQ